MVILWPQSCMRRPDLIANPYIWDDERTKRVKEKVEKERASRIRGGKKVKVNQNWSINCSKDKSGGKRLMVTWVCLETLDLANYSRTKNSRWTRLAGPGRHGLGAFHC